MPNIHCTICHMEFSDQNTICPGCGRQVDQAHPPTTDDQVPAPPPHVGITIGPGAEGSDETDDTDVGLDLEPETEPAAPGADEPEQPA